MRFDKFTTKFQQAFSDAQSLAVGQDNPYIEPQHLLQALLQQDDGSTTSLLSRAGVNVQALKTALAAALKRLPKVEGQAGEVNVSRELTALLNITTGARFTTYAIEAPRGSRVIGVNGAAARLVQKGDKVIVVTYGMLPAEEARNYAPTVVLLDDDNEIKKAA